MQDQTTEFTEMVQAIIERAEELKILNPKHKALLWFIKIMETTPSGTMFERAFYKKFKKDDETDVDMCVNYLCYLEDAIAQENKKVETAAAQKYKSLVLEGLK